MAYTLTVAHESKKLTTVFFLKKVTQYSIDKVYALTVLSFSVNFSTLFSASLALDSSAAF